MISKEAHLLAYLEEFITPERKERFTQILSQRTEHFTVAIEDLFQVHNTSAVVRTCEVFGVQTAHIIEEKYGKRLDSKIAMGAEKWVTTVRYPHTQPPYLHPGLLLCRSLILPPRVPFSLALSAMDSLKRLSPKLMSA